MRESSHRWLPRCVVVVIALLGILVGSTGCAPKYTDYDSFIQTPLPIVGGHPYVIEPPDQLRIISPAAEELHDTIVTLRPDGFVTLYLLGEIFAAGKTPTQLSNEIQERLLTYYQDASIQVEVIGFHSKSYYMAGEVKSGPRPYTGKDTVLDAVLSAGIPRTAWPEKLVVLRPNEQGDLIRRMTVDFRDMVEKGELKYNVVLEEGDIVFLPINPMAAIGVAVQNILFPVSPLLSALSGPAQIANFRSSN